MLWKAIFVIAALAVPALAEEPSNCKRPDGGYHNVTEINADGSFCTMLPPFGSQEVAPDEACANSYCFNGKYTNTTTHLVGPAALILSTNYVENTTSQYVQVTGCIDGTKWGLNSTDQGGQMDSHGWQYQCKGYKKFVSLLEPATNTYCIRCCNGNVDVDCDTSHSTKGCWNLIPGAYTMKDGSVCAAPAGSNTTLPLPSGSSAVPSGTATATATAPGTSGTGAAGTTSAGATKPTGTTGSAGSRFSFSLETAGLAVAAVLAAAASL